MIHLTTLSPPAKDALLLLYVAAAPAAVSAVLVQERQDEEKKTQSPVYFVSEALSPTKANYSEIEKVIYVVVMA